MRKRVRVRVLLFGEGSGHETTIAGTYGGGSGFETSWPGSITICCRNLFETSWPAALAIEA